MWSESVGQATERPGTHRWWLAAVLVTMPLWAAAAETFYDLDGQPRRLEEFLGQGKWTVVTVWASDCPVCNREIHELVAFHAARHDRDAAVLGISVDGLAGKADAQAFIARHRVNFPNLIDDGRAFGALYRRIAGTPWFGGTPINLIFNPAGEAVARRIGPLSQSDLEAFLAREAGGRHNGT